MRVKDISHLEYGKPSTRVFYENSNEELIELEEIDNLDLEVIGLTVIDYDIACIVNAKDAFVEKMYLDLLKIYKD